MPKISEVFNFNKDNLLSKLKEKYEDIDLTGNLNEEINRIKKKKQKEAFDKLIEKKFTNEMIKDLLSYIKNRTKENDKKVLDYLEWDTNVPTIFEYLIGIVWYKISELKGDLVEFMNLSLDAKLLPRRFAGGGQADIVYKYDDHDVLLEVTLSNKDNQRKMELEPVSRHLGKYLLENGDSHYAVFIAPYLDPNVLVGLRSYSKLNYYNVSDTDKYVENLKIIPLDIDNIVCIMENNVKYKDLYLAINELYSSNDEDGYSWYKNEVIKKITTL